MKTLSTVILALGLIGASAPAQTSAPGQDKKQAEHKDKAKGELKDSKAKNKAAEKAKTQTEKK